MKQGHRPMKRCRLWGDSYDYLSTGGKATPYVLIERRQGHAIHAAVLLRRGAVGAYAGHTEGADSAGVQCLHSEHREKRPLSRRREAATDLDGHHHPREGG